MFIESPSEKNYIFVIVTKEESILYTPCFGNGKQRKHKQNQNAEHCKCYREKNLKECKSQDVFSEKKFKIDFEIQ